MNKKLFYIFGWLFMSLMAFGGFNNAVEVIWGDPIIKPWGTSTYLKDSANYVTLNDGFYARDSIKTDRDLIVRGAVVLDTNRLGKVYYNANQLLISNSKTGNSDIVNTIGFGASQYYWNKSRSLGVDVELARLDTINGLTLSGYNIQTSSTGQIKLPSDTASDYDANDAVTINRQSGVITTKSLTTAAQNFYTLTLTNSLISANTKIFAVVRTNAGNGVPIVTQCPAGSGSGTILVFNAHASSAFNSAITIAFIIFN